MATNLAIDDELIDEARRVGGHTTKKQAVTVALEEYVARRKQLAVLDLFGTIDFDKSHDYRSSRQLDRICRAKGVQCGEVEMLLCAAALHYGWTILTSDTGLLRCIEVIETESTHARKPRE